MSDLECYKEVKDAFMQSDMQVGTNKLVQLCGISLEEAKKIMNKYQDLENVKKRFSSNSKISDDIESIKTRIFMTYAAKASAYDNNRVPK